MFKLFNFNAYPERFNNSAALPEKKAQEIIERVSLQPGQIVLDLGSGGGFFSFQFANKLLPKGKVYALDTNKRYLDFIMKKANQNNINNIFPILNSEKSFRLPENIKIDVLFCRNVYHHLKNRVSYFLSIKPYLKNDGKIIIIDYKNIEGFSYHAIFRHYTLESTITNELTQAGYKFVKKYDFLPEQCFLEFTV